MDPREGWYDDPRTPGQLRWWDGTAWTEHTHVRPPSEAATSAGEAVTADGTPSDHGASRAAADASTGPSSAATSSSPADAWPEPTPATGGAPATGAAPATGTAPQEGTFPSWGGPPVADRPVGGGNARVLIGVGLAATILVIAGLVSFGGSTSTSDDLTAIDRRSDDGPSDVTFGGNVRVGQRTAGSVAPDGAWSTDLIVDDPTDVRIDVRGEPGFDPIATLYRDGDVVDRNDDRGSARADELGGDMLDPLLELDLGPGTYTLEVTGFGSSSGAFELLVDRR